MVKEAEKQDETRTKKERKKERKKKRKKKDVGSAMDVDDVRARAARLLERHAERLKSRAMEDDDSDSQDEQEKGNVNVTSHRSDDMQREKANEENEEEEEEEEDESMDPPAAPETARAAAVELPAGTQSTDGIAPSSSSLASRSVPTPGRGRQGRQDAENVETYLLQRGGRARPNCAVLLLRRRGRRHQSTPLLQQFRKRHKICFERSLLSFVYSESI